ncbi:Uncharacterised protein [Escherichia coli]|nr:Uncharacterised protein [Escherichia coli]
MFGEEGFVGSINGSEVVQIFHKHGGFNDVAHFQASGFDDRFLRYPATDVPVQRTSAGTSPVFGFTGI